MEYDLLLIPLHCDFKNEQIQLIIKPLLQTNFNAIM